MACFWCRYGSRVLKYGDPGWREESWDDAAIDCILNPVSVRVSGSHTCSFLSLKDPELVVNFRRQIQWGRIDEMKSENRYKKAEARVKVLNKRLRESK